MSGQPAEFSLTITDAAQRLGIHPNTLVRWTAAGRISCLRTLGGWRRYRPEDVDRLALELTSSTVGSSGVPTADAAAVSPQSPGPVPPTGDAVPQLVHARAADGSGPGASPEAAPGPFFDATPEGATP